MGVVEGWGWERRQERRNFLAALRVKPTWALLEEKLEKTGLWSWHQAGRRKGRVGGKPHQDKPRPCFPAGQEGRTRTCQPAASCCAGRQQRTAHGAAGSSSALSQATGPDRAIFGEKLIHFPPG